MSELIKLSEENLLNLTKTDIDFLVDNVISKYKEGDLDIHLLLAFAAKGQAVFADLLAKAKEEFQGQLPSKAEDWYNMTITPKKTTTLDYSGCGDLILARYEERKSALDAQIKGRKEMLKNLSTPINDIDMEEGEEFEIKPPVKLTGETFSITIAK